MTGEAEGARGMPDSVGRDVGTGVAAWTLRTLRTLRAYAVSRRGAGMLVTGAFSLLVLAGVGSLMTNYAWREAQWVELREATRAAVMAAGHLLGDTTTEARQKAKEKIAGFVEGLVDDLEVGADGVGIVVDGDVIAVSITGQYPFDGLWAPDRGPEQVSDTVRVRFDSAPREIALAVDMSGSMKRNLVGGRSAIDVQYTGMERIAGIMRMLKQPGMGDEAEFMASVVPFGMTVRAADLCRTPGHTDRMPSQCDQDENERKRTYVRLLAGAEADFADTMANARRARDDDKGGHWVDAYVHYGAGTDMGPLHRQYLPDSLLDNGNWNLDRRDVAIDVSAQVPSLGTWTVNDTDFWNGCVMARWGAYWHPDARPDNWDPAEPTNWPARAPVAGWGAAGAALPADTPLHLSDAPPDDADPHTLFTAFSYPDARIGNAADFQVQWAMANALAAYDQQYRDGGFTYRRAAARWRFVGKPVNDWSVPGQRGWKGCVNVPVMELTHDRDYVLTHGAWMKDWVKSTAITGFKPAHTLADCDDIVANTPGIGSSDFSDGECRSPFAGGTQPHLGIVWGLRALSPLWQDVWDVTDARGVARPAVRCVGGLPEGCVRNLTKTLVLITDNPPYWGEAQRTRLGWDGIVDGGYTDNQDVHPPALSWMCDYDGHGSSTANAFARRYLRVAQHSEPDDFNEEFVTRLTAASGGNSGFRPGTARFNADGREWIADAFFWIGRRIGTHVPGERAARESEMEQALEALDPTPWQMFWGLDPEVVDALVEPDNGFGLAGRPTKYMNLCRLNSAFGMYGMLDDHVHVGKDDNGDPIAPILGVAPFAAAEAFQDDPDADWHPSWDDFTGSPGRRPIPNWMARNRLDEWLVEACRLVGLRGVELKVVQMSRDGDRDLVFERCITAAGGVVDSDLIVAQSSDDYLDWLAEQLPSTEGRLQFVN